MDFSLIVPGRFQFQLDLCISVQYYLFNDVMVEHYGESLYWR